MPDIPAVPGAGRLADRVAAFFDTAGPLARAIPDYEPRDTQQTMAGAVADVLDRGGLLLVEAGTGTGKTLAYLVPAILSGHRTLVSTGTKNLQEQIFFKDLPLLREALGVPFTAACMKGRGNYLCLHRLRLFRDQPVFRSIDEAAHFRRIEAWAPTTNEGDRAEVEDLPEDLGFWNEIAATSENCLGTDCPDYLQCFVTRMRQRAAESDLVIVNHHLLCADAAVRNDSFGAVIPECHYAIIDEAHQLEDVATQYFGRGVSTYRFDELARDTERFLGQTAAVDRDRRDELLLLVRRMQERAKSFLANLAQVGRPGSDGRPVEERVRVTARSLERAREPGVALIDGLEAVDSAVALFREPTDDLRSIGRRAGELRDELRFLLRADESGFVYFLERRGRGVFLRASPIDVSDIVRDLLVDRAGGTVLTSATLAVGDSFDHVRRRLGLQGARELRLPSEFDFRRQALLYLPPAMPDPRSPRFPEAAAQQIGSLLTLSRGRAFVLFTSYAVLRAVEALVRQVLPFPLLVQGQAPRSALLREFKTTPHAVLFATSSFWQGVDVIGEALSCVIIDKLPFASPADPVTAARIEALRERGEDAFGDYQVPLAVLTLMQGVGRLIRHRQDRGVLAILDPRIRSKAYGTRFLEALPPLPLTRDLAVVARFFDA